MTASPGLSALTEAQADLVRAAFGDGDTATAAWRRWRDGIDWDAHLDPDSFRLMPSVGRNLRRLGVDDPLGPRFAGIARQAWYANQLRLRRFQPVLQALGGAGVRLAPLPPHWLLLLDGSAVLERDAPLACALPGTSVDAATRCLWRNGWRPYPPRPRGSLDAFTLVEGELAWQDGRGSSLVLAWQRDAGDPDGRFPDAVWKRARDARLMNEPVLALSAGDAIRELCRRPPTGDAMAAAVDLLLHLDAATFGATPPDEPAPRIVIDASWRPVADDLRAILHDLPEFEAPRIASSRDLPSPPPTPDRGLRARLAMHWSTYRRAWGAGYSWPAAVVRLPGYLMLKWQLTTPRQLPRRFWRGLRWEWRHSRRGRASDRRGRPASGRDAR